MTTTELAQYELVVWADTTGCWFAPQHSAETAVRPEYWSAAQSLVDSGRIAQPRMASTGGHPVLTLRLVQVERLGAHWCFTIQINGADAGYSDSCRFLFIPVQPSTPTHQDAPAQRRNPAQRITPTQAWRTGITAWAGLTSSPGPSPHGPATSRRDQAAATQSTAHSAAQTAAPTPALPTDRPAGHPAADTVLGILAAIAMDAQHLRVPGTPAEVATVIGEVLAMLPAAVAAGLVWTTCPVQTPLPGERTVAGDLPEELRLRDLDLSRRLDRLDWSEPVRRDQVEASLPIPRAAALHRMVDAFGDDPLLETVRRSRASTLDELLDEIAGQAEPLVAGVVPDQVAALLADPDQWQQLRDHPGSARRWAERNPDRAMAVLTRRKAPGPDDPLRAELIRGAVLPMVAGELWSTPPKPATVGLLREYAQNVRHRAAAVRAIRDRGLILADEAGLEASYRWLRQVGLSPWLDRDLFPDRARAIADEIARGGSELVLARQELSTAWNDRRELVFAVITKSGFWHRGVAKSLLNTAGQSTDPGQPAELLDLARLAAALTRAAARRRTGKVAGWLREVLGYLTDQGIHPTAIRWIMYGALPEVPGRRWLRHRASLIELLEACDDIGLDAEAPPVVNALLSEYRAMASTEPAREQLGPNRVTVALGRLAPTMVAVAVPLTVVGLLLWYTGWHGSREDRPTGAAAVAAATGNNGAANGAANGADAGSKVGTGQQDANGAPRPPDGQQQAKAGPGSATPPTPKPGTTPLDVVLEYEGSSGALTALTDQLRQRIHRQVPSGHRVTQVEVTATAVTCEFGLGYAGKVRSHLVDAKLSELRGATFGQPKCASSGDSPDPPGTVRIHLVHAAG